MPPCRRVAVRPGVGGAGPAGVRLATGMAAILYYEYVADILERRAPHRAAHLAILSEWYDAGRCLLAGATGDPVSGAALVFATEEDAVDFVGRDPYVEAGLVRAHRIEPIAVVVPPPAG